MAELTYTDGILLGALKLGSTFNITAASPLDSRNVVGKIENLTNTDTWKEVATYLGMTVTVQETGSMYILIDPSNITDLKLGWKQVGSGLGNLVVDKYHEALDSATTDNIGQLVYVKQTEYAVEDETGGTEYLDVKPTGTTAYTTYSAGCYVVTGSNKLMKLAQSSVTGDIEGEVAELQEEVSDLTDASSAMLDRIIKLENDTTHIISGDDLED